MSIRLLCSLLIACSFAYADDSKTQARTKAPARFLLVPADACASEPTDNVKQLCSPKQLPFDIQDYNIVPTADAGYVQLAFKNSVETDNMELLCYRCTLEKGTREKCARYENVWGNRGWTERCPKVKN